MSPRPTVETERRQQILQAAWRCFALNGYENATMDQIAEALPFSKALVYYYFDSKRDLFLALLSDWANGVVARWNDLLPANAHPDAKLRRCIEFAVEILTEDPDLPRVEMEFWGQLHREPAVTATIREIYAAFRAELAGIIRDGIEQGIYRPVNPETLAAFIVGAYDGLALQAVADPDALDWPAMIDSIYDMVMHGLSIAEG
ncbi:MAG: TetR/AcrR family transcriptional regulator [Anaerolineae bacterium]